MSGSDPNVDLSLTCSSSAIARAARMDTFLSAESEPSWAWYAVYTRPRHEKSVAAQCSLRSVDCFLPTYIARRNWGHRHAVVELPLFPSYVFVHISLRNKLHVQTIPGLVSFVTVSGRPVQLADLEILALQNAVRCRNAEPHPYVSVGRKVRIISGPLEGLEGIVTRRKDRVRIIVSIHWMSRSVAVQLEEEDVQALV